jgi:hypothetical protein
MSSNAEKYDAVIIGRRPSRVELRDTPRKKWAKGPACRAKEVSQIKAVRRVHLTRMPVSFCRTRGSRRDVRRRRCRYHAYCFSMPAAAAAFMSQRVGCVGFARHWAQSLSDGPRFCCQGPSAAGVEVVEETAPTALLRNAEDRCAE